MRLVDLLAIIYDRTQRVKPRSAHATVHTISRVLEAPRVGDAEGPEGRTALIPQPAYWAGTEEPYDPTQHMKWGEGIWTS